MKIIVKPRQAGKTHELVQWVLEGEATDSYPFWSRVMVCPSIGMADHVRRTHPELDYRQVFGWDEWKRARLGRRSVEVAIDNADIILANMIGQHPTVITVNGEGS